MDYISNLIVKINNGNKSGKELVSLPFTKIGGAIAETLQKEGFIETYSKKGKKIKMLEIKLAYADSMPRITGVKRLSTPSKRIYRGASKIWPVLRGYGRLIVSTPKGVMSDVEARKQKIGGEALFEIW